MKNRSEAAGEIAKSGGALALEYYQRVAGLAVVNKGVQDFVTEADQAVETHIRALIEAAFPEDGIVGEEHAPKPGTSGYRWVIDPIDGTANFINSIPAWTVVLAVVKDDQTEIGVVFDPVHDEVFHALRGAGATLNGMSMVCPAEGSIDRGSVGIGRSNRAGIRGTTKLIEQLLTRNGMFFRNASGAISLAYVAAGRLIGYVEEHMNAWDCLAGQLLVAEAGGRIETQSADDMLENGGRVVAGSAGVFEALRDLADSAFEDA